MQQFLLPLLVQANFPVIFTYKSDCYISIFLHKTSNIWIIAPCSKIDIPSLLIKIFPAVREGILIIRIGITLVAEGIIMIGLCYRTACICWLYHIAIGIVQRILSGSHCIFAGTRAGFSTFQTYLIFRQWVVRERVDRREILKNVLVSIHLPFLPDFN